MTLKRLSLTIVASSALFLAACGSDDSSDAAESTTAGATSTAAAESCPTAAPAGDVAPEWTLQGTTGSVEVTGSTDSAAPKVTVASPFSVDATQVQTLTEGTGAVVPETAEVSVCYVGVNGRDGSTFDSSYETGSPVDFPLTGVIPGFQKAIAGQKVGSTVGVAMTSADGYASGNPAAGIDAGDSLIFAIKILSAQG
ncbi:FKBP-type peptidyl-prolyl cis-trans isomerase [Williamsia soli]|uniref:FKBP-type peptidyl-prolyl cis-trans isomerase n=1 Tax=Williamsia soli TaxID=364929 RepID=UPI001A9EC9BA|nr:FKBP-type peptidyl-prolyl cis-trans isomerase [Williamsia soli]